jgi:RNA recognition motif-containing protein
MWLNFWMKLTGLISPVSFGYVKFDSVDAARNAIGAMHMQVYEGRRLALNFAQSNFPSTSTSPGETSVPTRTIYVGNIPFEMTDRELNDMMSALPSIGGPDSLAASATPSLSMSIAPRLRLRS